MTEHNCAFCDYDEYDVIAKNDFGVVLVEEKPLSKGHSVIIPRRHVESFFDLTEKEHQSLLQLLDLARNELVIRHKPNGFHVSFDDGTVFGNTSEHLHIHIVPHYEGQNINLDARWGIQK